MMVVKHRERGEAGIWNVDYAGYVLFTGSYGNFQVRKEWKMALSEKVEEIVARYKPYGAVYEPGEKAPYSGTFKCDMGTMLAPQRVQLSRGEAFPEVESLGEHTRWTGTNIQS